MNKCLKLIVSWGRQSPTSIIRNWWNAPEPTPWSDEIQEGVQRPDAVQICHHCLTPQEHPGWFCQKCGAATGPYNNCMPFINVFSTGEVLRAGVDPKINLPRWVRPTYWLVGLFEFGIFTPFYWFRLFRAQKRRRENISVNDDGSKI